MAVALHRWLLLLLLATVLLAIQQQRHAVEAVDAAFTSSCSGPRVRKAWGMMTASEQSLYSEAVALAMQRGFHALFTEVHSESASASEAYMTCGFLYWNRRFLLAYETMLRSLNPRFACVTIPYWDYFADYARLMDGSCSTLGTCSPILAGLGGSSGSRRSVTINGLKIKGRCSASAPQSSFCQSSTITNATKCAHCVPRGDWSSTPFPSGFGYAGLSVTLASARGFREFSNNIQLGIHNSIHNALSSTMATYMASADPVFFSHHATIDMLHQIYLECKLGAGISNVDASASRFAFQKCTYDYRETAPSLTSTVTQLWHVSAYVTKKTTVAIRAELNPTLAPFFSGLPSQYQDLLSIKDLGSFSYDYQRDDLVLNLSQNGFVCPSTATMTPSSSQSLKRQDGDAHRSLTRFGSADGVSGSESSLPLAGVASLAAVRVVANIASSAASKVDLSVSSSGKSSSSSDTGSSGATGDGMASQIGSLFMRAQRERIAAQQLAVSFFDDAMVSAIQVDGTESTALSQVELMECLNHDESLGGVKDYSAFFRANFPVHQDDYPRCFDLLHVKREKNRVRNWRSIIRRVFRAGRIG